ncbi:MAG: FecR domain-containing protein [Deltaproteobacteria bacterium]|nr:FecR domain-containing protein [Deltaproteobacteria bacterium]
MPLDDRTRRRLALLAEDEAPGLDPARREELIADLRREGPAVVRRARVVRQVVRGGAALGVVSAALLVLTLRTGAPPPALTARACEAWPPSGHDARFAAQASQLGLELTRARLRASSGAEVEVTELSACRMIVSLSSGDLWVHARELGGGELRVRTPHSEVTVHGTIFRVSAEPEAVEVAVAEGVVEVSGGGAPAALVRRGERIRRGKQGASSTSALPREQTEVILEKLGVPELAELDTEAHDPLPVADDVDEQEPAAEVADEDTADDQVEPGSSERRRSARALRRARLREARRAALERRQSAEALLEARGTEASKLEARKPEPKAPETAALPPLGTIGTRRPAPGPVVAPQAPTPAPTPPLESAAVLVKRGEALRRAGDLDGARVAFRNAGGQSGPTAEAAWIALARLELDDGEPEDARRALTERQRRFATGVLGVESAWLAVLVEEQVGDLDAARAAARSLTQRWPNTPQADAARRWLDGRGAQRDR